MRRLVVLALMGSLALAQDNPGGPGCCGEDKAVEKQDKAGCGQQGVVGQAKTGCAKTGCAKTGCAMGGCGEDALEVALPLSGLDETKKLDVVRQVVRKGIALSDFDFKGDVFVVSLRKGEALDLASLETGIALAGATLDHSSFILPAAVSLDIEGMSCMGCAQGVRQVLEACQGTTVADIQVGRAELSFARDTTLAEIEALFAGHERFRIAAVHFSRKAEPVAAVATLTLVVETPANAFANDKDAAGAYVCPISGNPIAEVTPDLEQIAVHHQGKVWLVCCKGCVSKLEKKLGG